MPFEVVWDAVAEAGNGAGNERGSMSWREARSGQ